MWTKKFISSERANDPERLLERVDLAFETGSYNIGIITGHRVDVLDVDVKNGKQGRAAVAALKAAGLLDGWVLLAETPSGGLHFYYPSGGGRGGSVPAWGLDFQAAGKYVLAPPSTLLEVKDGEVGVGKYSWLERGDGAGRPLDWRACKLALGVSTGSASLVSREANSADFTVEGLAAWLTGQNQNRNSALYWAACRAVESGASQSDLATLVAASLSLSLPGEDREDELWKTALSALKGQS
jgi:hypothetical protein